MIFHLSGSALQAIEAITSNPEIKRGDDNGLIRFML
jgi:hypothetical protein